ncbi:enterochelin esterase [Acerihabitans arboris]|uniref:Enterochelin esterase n=1 Tax=Acerihabitans arboris TaxID=2691583 RepID=A0A845SMI6_9GAMM|nr:enterochelin esterase [Acerihabitans arboris]NDL63831.1 enterochelin esterase [Acerihabitans arboris]
MNKEILARADVGGDGWWREVERQGAPWVEPGPAGQCGVIFLWRDPEGDERASAIRRVWINISGVTDHHGNTGPQSLERIAGTDVWYWQTRLGESWRGSYCFIPCRDDGAFVTLTMAPVDRAALRNAWRGLFAGAVADRLNPLRAWTNGRGHPVSALHMPRAPAQAAWREFDKIGPVAGRTLPPLPAPAGLERHRWLSERLGNTRDIWIFTTGRRREAERPLAILLDGQFWSRQMPVWSPLLHMTRTGGLPEAVYVLIDAIDTRQRGRELTCNPDFWLAVREELLPQLATWAPYRADPATTVVAGQSFGGLSALYAALNWPGHFGCVLSQSGSFWWPDRDLAQAENVPGDASRLLGQIAQGLGDGQALKAFIEVGAREQLIHRVNDRLADLLRRRGHQVDYRVVDGGHDALCWRGGLLDGLAALWSGMSPMPWLFTRA